MHRDKIDELIVEIQENSLRIRQLEQEELVKEYRERTKIASKLSEKYLREIYIKQFNCEHAVWYKMRESTDDYECRTYYTCKCLDCGKVEENRDRDFNGLILDTEIKYEKVKEIYEEVCKITNVKETRESLLREWIYEIRNK